MKENAKYTKCARARSRALVDQIWPARLIGLVPLTNFDVDIFSEKWILSELELSTKSVLSTANFVENILSTKNLSSNRGHHWICRKHNESVAFCLSSPPPRFGRPYRKVKIWKLICSFLEISLGHPPCQKPWRLLSGTSKVILDSMMTLWRHMGDGAHCLLEGGRK